jgi:hypothetical protein
MKEKDIRETVRNIDDWENVSYSVMNSVWDNLRDSVSSSVVNSTRYSVKWKVEENVTWPLLNALEGVIK